ncbi:MAG: MarR family transcriptional regulator [Rhodospirillales bacterium]
MHLSEVEALELWRRTIVAGVRDDVPDLSARQMAVLLTVYLKPPPHTVRGLAGALKISKPAITRSLDRLSDLGLVRRKIDESDRRSVLIQRTIHGSVFLREYGEMIVASGHALDDQSDVATPFPFETALSGGIA